MSTRKISAREFGRFLEANFPDFFQHGIFLEDPLHQQTKQTRSGKTSSSFFSFFSACHLFFFPSHNQPRQEPFLRLKLLCVSSTWKRKKKKEKEWWIRARGRLGRFRIASCCVIQPGQYLTEWSKNWGSSSCQEDCQDSNEGHCL